MGYALADDGYSCQGRLGDRCDECAECMIRVCVHVDVNECLPEVRVCTQLCNNSDGGFQCYCEPGYNLASDERTCSGNILVSHSSNSMFMHLTIL